MIFLYIGIFLIISGILLIIYVIKNPTKGSAVAADFQGILAGIGLIIIGLFMIINEW